MQGKLTLIRRGDNAFHVKNHNTVRRVLSSQNEHLINSFGIIQGRVYAVYLFHNENAVEIA